MAILGSLTPSANTDTDLYTVGNADGATVSCVMVCNQNATGALVRVAVLPTGGTVATQNYVYHDINIPPYESLAVTMGMNIAQNGKIVVRADSTNVSFNAFGIGG